MSSSTPTTAPDAGASGLAARLRASVVTGRGPLLPGRLALLAALATLVVIVGLVADSPVRYSLVIGTIFAIAILGNNAILATLGELNLAAGAFMAIGAYTAAYLLSKETPLILALGAVLVVSAVLGALIAVPTVRLTGLFTALATFALAFAIPDLTLALSPITGGDAGLAVTPPIIADVLIDGSSRVMLVAVVVLFFLLAAASLLLFSRSAGASLLAVGEAQHAASAFGLRSTALKIATWTWAAVLGGVAGAAYALAVGFLNPTIFTIFLSISLLAGALVGGARSVAGAFIGGMLVGALPPNIQSVVPASATGMVFGTILLVALLGGAGGVGALLERQALRPLIKRGRA